MSVPAVLGQEHWPSQPFCSCQGRGKLGAGRLVEQKDGQTRGLRRDPRVTDLTRSLRLRDTSGEVINPRCCCPTGVVVLVPCGGLARTEGCEAQVW